MNRNIRILCVIAATLMAPAVGFASDAAVNDGDVAKVYVKDSTITSEVKARLAAEHVKSLARIDVDTDDHGVVKLSGHVRSQEEMDEAVSIARYTGGVREVKNHLQIKLDD